MVYVKEDINQPSLPTPFYSVLASVSVFMTLSTVFYSINSHDNSPFSHSVIPVFLSLCLIGPFNCKIISLYKSPLSALIYSLVVGWAQNNNELTKSPVSLFLISGRAVNDVRGVAVVQMTENEATHQLSSE